jgi:hypothetical protein
MNSNLLPLFAVFEVEVFFIASFNKKIDINIIQLAWKQVVNNDVMHTKGQWRPFSSTTLLLIKSLPANPGLQSGDKTFSSSCSMNSAACSFRRFSSPSASLAVSWT